MGFAENVLGEGAFPFRASLFDKSSQANWLVVWHQDTALPLRQRKEIPGWGPWSVKEGIACAHAPGPALELILAIRVHLNDSNEENGSLRVLPRTHRLGVLSDDSIHNLVEKVDPVDCYVQAGGVLLMRPLLVHSSSKARAKTGPRQVLHIEFARSKSLPGGLELAMCEGFNRQHQMHE
jgi:ectoine hydroxylase-related dioxygenase (phytanoyl-CoA dioxygenase family)